MKNIFGIGRGSIQLVQRGHHRIFHAMPLQKVAHGKLQFIPAGTDAGQYFFFAESKVHVLVC